MATLRQQDILSTGSKGSAMMGIQRTCTVRAAAACAPGWASPNACRPIRLQPEATMKLSCTGARSSGPKAPQSLRTGDAKLDQLGFDLRNCGQTMYLATSTADGKWSGGLTQYGPIALEPAAQVLSYGQAILEGLKAQRSMATGEIALFRPQAHARRMRQGARRMCMADLPEDVFMHAVVSTIQANVCMVPPAGAGMLYIRPLLLGTGARLGVGPAPEYTFVVFCAAVGQYYKSHGQGADLLIETEMYRGTPGGVGATKCAGNYAAILQSQLQAKRAGFTDVLLVDVSRQHLEEASAGNVFVVSGKRVKTPKLKGTFLEGVMRDSVLQLLEDAGYHTEEADVSVAEAMSAKEMFLSGTAAGVCVVNTLTFEDNLTTFPSTELGYRVKQKLDRIQLAQDGDDHGWLYML
eukprot:jgi/Ulvmu1/1677/UM115_0006.1